MGEFRHCLKTKTKANTAGNMLIDLPSNQIKEDKWDSSVALEVPEHCMVNNMKYRFDKKEVNYLYPLQFRIDSYTEREKHFFEQGITLHDNYNGESNEITNMCIWLG